jgi:hypothetical protein
MISGSFPVSTTRSNLFTSSSGSPSPVGYSNFTAVGHLRTRPRFTETQSEPTLHSIVSPAREMVSVSPGLISPCIGCKRSATDVRSVSDPLQGRSHNSAHGERNDEPNHYRKRRRNDDGTLSGSPTASSAPSTPDLDPVYNHSDRSKHMTSRSKLSTTARSIHDKLREELQKQLTPSDTKGVMYILFDPCCKDAGYKIGWTTRAYAKRIQEHDRDCSYTPEVIHVSGHEIEYCGRLERLVHIDLKNYCQPRYCDMHRDSNGVSITRKHEEWFYVTEEMAIETVKRWEDFMHNQKPYGWNRRLRAVWRHMLERRTPLSLDVRTFTHKIRREQWTHILAPPTTADHIEVYHKAIRGAAKTIHNVISCTWMYLYAFFWELSTLIYSAITLMWYRNIVTLTAFAFFLTCAGIAVLAHVKLHSPKRRPRTPIKVR